MLVLSRKPDQRIMIGSNIVLTVVGIAGDRVYIGVKAPRNVSINREEIQDIIDAERDEAYRLNRAEGSVD